MRAKRDRRYGKKKPKISSKVSKKPASLNWGTEDRNAGTLRKIEKAIQEEKENLT